MPVPPFLAAALQFRVDVADVPANRERAVRLIGEAAGRGARLCVLPEMWSTGFAEERLLPLSRTTPEVLHELRSLAARLKVVVAGSLPERVGRGVYNTLYVVNATGVVTGEYRKTHLFSPSGEDRWFRGVFPRASFPRTPEPWAPSSATTSGSRNFPGNISSPARKCCACRPSGLPSGAPIGGSSRSPGRSKARRTSSRRTPSDRRVRSVTRATR